MRTSFSERAWREYQEWQATDRQMLRRIHALIREMQRTPYEGTGKPEPLRHEFAGYWSRRITDEHRMIYRVEGDELIIQQMKHHY